MQANEDEEVLGYGGGFYVPVKMENLNIGQTEEQKAEMHQLWGGVEPEGSEELGPGNGVELWDRPTGYFTVGVPILMAGRKEVVHNLCLQMSWYTLVSLEEPERVGGLRGDWFVEGVHVKKREEMQMARLMAKLGGDFRLMLRPEWVDGVKLQMIWGLGPTSTKVTLAMTKQLVYGASIEWEGEQRLLQTGKTSVVPRRLDAGRV